MSERISEYYCNQALHHSMCLCAMWVRKRNSGSLGVDFEGILEVGCCLVPTVQRHVGQRSMPKYDSMGGWVSRAEPKRQERDTHRERGRAGQTLRLALVQEKFSFVWFKKDCVSVCTVQECAGNGMKDTSHVTSYCTDTPHIQTRGSFQTLTSPIKSGHCA